MSPPDRQRTARQQAIEALQGEPGRRSREHRRENALHVLATISAALPGSETQKRLQLWLAGRLKRTRQPPLRSTMKWPTSVDEESFAAIDA